MTTICTDFAGCPTQERKINETAKGVHLDRNTKWTLKQSRRWVFMDQRASTWQPGQGLLLLLLLWLFYKDICVIRMCLSALQLRQSGNLSRMEPRLWPVYITAIHVIQSVGCRL